MLSIHRVLEHRARAVVALLALLLAALGVSACGGGDSGGGGGGDTADVETLLTQTFTGTHEIKSGKASLDVKVDIQGGRGPLNGTVELKVDGPFQTAGTDELPKFDLGLDIHAQGQGFEAGLVSTSDRLFVKFGGTAYEAPATLVNQMKQSFKSSQSSKSGFSLDSLGVDPMSWLQDSTVVGSESIGGVETEHISATVDEGALLDDVDELLGKLKDQIPAGAAGAQVPDHLSADTRQQVEDAVKDAKVDIWTGTDDKTLRKIVVTLRVEPPASANSPKSLDISISFELQDLNEPQTIEAPATTRPLSELLGQIQGLLGGALGGSALGGGGSGAAPNIDKYTACLEDAQGDVTKAQKCADLLTQ